MKRIEYTIVQGVVREINKYLKHRERMMIHYGAHCTTAKMATISKVRRELDNASQWYWQQKAQLIQRLLPDLHTISAGQSSKYYTTEHHRLREWEEAMQVLLSPHRERLTVGTAQ